MAPRHPVLPPGAEFLPACVRLVDSCCAAGAARESAEEQEARCHAAAHQRVMGGRCLRMSVKAFFGGVFAEGVTPSSFECYEYNRDRGVSRWRRRCLNAVRLQARARCPRLFHATRHLRSARRRSATVENAVAQFCRVRKRLSSASSAASILMTAMLEPVVGSRRRKRGGAKPTLAGCPPQARGVAGVVMWRITPQPSKPRRR